METSPGYVEWDGKFFKFEAARAYFSDDGITLEAEGDKVSVMLWEYQFRPLDKLEFEQLVGRMFEAPDVNGESPQITIRGNEISAESFAIEFKTYDLERKLLIVEMRVRGYAPDEPRYSGDFIAFLRCAAE